MLWQRIEELIAVPDGDGKVSRKDRPWLRALLAAREEADTAGDAKRLAQCEQVARAVVYGGESCQHAARENGLDLRGGAG